MGASIFSPSGFPVGGGQLDAMKLLESDHVQLRRMLQELADASGSGALDRKKTVFRSFRRSLLSHALVEEEILYPALMRTRSEAARHAVKDALGEHQGIESLMAEIDQIEPDDDGYDVRVDALRASVERHLAGEEQRMFEHARNNLTDDRLLALGRQMMARRERLRQGEAAEG